MVLEGKYVLPSGETLSVSLVVSVNTWRGGQWTGFHQCSAREFESAMEVLRRGGEIGFIPYVGEVDG